MPGIKNLRLPVTCVSKKHWTNGILDDIMEVITWSCEAAFRGKHPSTRHDGSAFTQTDHKRKKMADKTLGFRGVLVEIRADWVWYVSALRFPAHNLKAGCCWKCAATPENIRETSAAAPWRNQLLNHWECVARWLQRGKTTSPIFAAPTVTVDICLIDWLHAMDKGVAASFLGNLLWMMMPLMRSKTWQQNAATCLNGYLPGMRPMGQQIASPTSCLRC